MTTTTRPSVAAAVGNLAHVVTIANTLAFGIAVATRMHRSAPDDDTWLDPAWKEQGFCVTHPAIPYWSSHDVCLYVDVLAAVLLYGVYVVLGKDIVALKQTNANFLNTLPGLVAHGIAHGSIAAVLRSNSTRGATNHPDRGASFQNASIAYGTDTGWELWRHMTTAQAIWQPLAGGIFWLGIFHSLMPKAKLPTKCLVIMPVVGLQLFVPGKFGFTYVQTVIMLLFSCVELVKSPAEKQDISYPLYACIVGVPVTMMAWLESTQCSAFVRDVLYGHVVYDAFIPLAILVWYLLCYGYVTWSAKAIKAKKE